MAPLLKRPRESIGRAVKNTHMGLNGGTKVIQDG